jgi:hypothetical protein
MFKNYPGLGKVAQKLEKLFEKGLFGSWLLILNSSTSRKV